jgi:peroxiredoxin
MTQLVELQKRLGDLEDEDLAVYAITYDSQEALATFADKYDVQYQLLADEGSKVIRDFGILNTLIDPDDAAVHPASGQPFYGIPFPGTYVTDVDGVVSEKYFFRHYANRASAGTILDGALGRALVHHESPADAAREQMATITARLADSALRMEVSTLVHVEVAVDEGFHVYAEPLPEGFVATTVSIPETAGLRIGEPIYPPTHSKQFPELGVTLPVFDGVADIAIPVTATVELFAGQPPAAKQARSISIPIEVVYQACSDSICFRPRSKSLELEVPLADLVSPGR